MKPSWTAASSGVSSCRVLQHPIAAPLPPPEGWNIMFDGFEKHLGMWKESRN